MLTPCRFAAALAILVSFASPAASAPAGRCDGKGCAADSTLELFVEALRDIRENYVDEVDEERLVEAAIKGMVEALDPHSRYLTPERLDEIRLRLHGEYGGLGLRVAKTGGRITVIEASPGMPASRAGIRSGDVITHLDGRPLTGLDLRQAIRRMRGPRDSKIAMTIRRDGVEEPIDVTLTRQAIKVHSVRYRAEGRIGYIRISRFDRQTQPGLEHAIATIEANLDSHLLGYILDLRGNPGGLVSEAVSVADSFLDGGLIVSTRGRRARSNRRFEATPGDLAHGLPVIVLIDRDSASAAEIVAGALQDHHRAVLVGSRSYGKGTVQSTLTLENDGAIRVTTARYYTPSGRSIHGVGLEPDIETGGREAANDDSGEAAPAPEDPPLARAVDLLCGLARTPATQARRTAEEASAMLRGASAGPASAGASPAKADDFEAFCTAPRPLVTANLPADV